MFDKLAVAFENKKPAIMLGGGLILIIGGAIWACNSSRHLDEVLEEAKDKIEEARLDYSGKAAKKEVAKVQRECAWKLFKMYAPGCAMMVGGVILVGKSHGKMAERLDIVSGKLTATAAAFGAYRGAVKRELGADADRYFYYGTEHAEFEKPAWTDEDGVEHPAETIVYSDTVDGDNVPGLIFDERSCYYNRIDQNENIRTLHLAEEDLRKQLITEGFLFMDRIKTRLGLEKYITQDDKVTGFIFDKNLGGAEQDIFSLGVFNTHDRKRVASGGYAGIYLLDPTSYDRGPVYILDLFEHVRKK